MIPWVIGILLAGAIGAAREARATISVLAPDKDNTIIQWSPDTPGDNPYKANGTGDIFVGRNNDDGQGPATISIRRGLVHFNLSSIPAGATITAATLTLRDVRGMNGDCLTTLHRVTKDWSEGASYFNGGQGAPAQAGDVTWIHAIYDPLNLATNHWTTPGGDFLSTISAQTIISDDLGDGQLFSWTGAGVLADVQAWVDGTAPNFGWLLKGDEEHGQTAKRLDSREPEEATDVAPTLVVNFAPAFAGDYNDDSRVDALDYVVWRNNLGQSIRLPNETMTYGSVTEVDFDVWKANYGHVEGPGSGSLAVPEPTTAWLVLGSAGLALAGRRECQLRVGSCP